MRGLPYGKRVLTTLVVGLVWSVGLFFFYPNRPVGLVASIAPPVGGTACICP